MKTPDDLGDLIDLSAVAVIIGGEEACLEGFEDLPIGSLDLAIAPRMCDRGAVHVDEALCRSSKTRS